MPDISAYAKGVMGEQAACEYLLSLGMQFVERRYRCPHGEIDLIMLDGDVLALVEVKAREHLTKECALTAVSPQKRRRLVEAALCYLGEHPEHAKRVIRFDALAIGCDGLLHVPDAFSGSEWG